MDADLKLLLGKILGETYRIQKRTDGMLCNVTDQRIYGLVNGIEFEINEELRWLMESNITSEDVMNVDEVLLQISKDPNELAAFKGYYDIEGRLSELGIDRGKAIRILKWVSLGGSFKEIMKKMDSDRSPIELRTFNLDEGEI